MVLAVAVLAALGCAGRANQTRRPDRSARPGVVLHETYAPTRYAAPDTLITYVTARAVRVTHASGDAIIDLDAERIVLLDRETRTYRDEDLGVWEARIHAAIELWGDDSNASPPQFERAGTASEISGYNCERYVLFLTRELLGSREMVEQQIWVTQELTLPSGAYAAYKRALGSIESVGMSGAATYPEGVILRRETRTRPADSARRVAPTVESSHVFRVESKDLPMQMFTVPHGYRAATR